jgi:hypothetical protein
LAEAAIFGDGGKVLQLFKGEVLQSIHASARVFEGVIYIDRIYNEIP